MWQGLRTVTDYKSNPISLSSADASIASELNTFNARFEAISSQHAETAEAEVNGWVGAPLTAVYLPFLSMTSGGLSSM